MVMFQQPSSEVAALDTGELLDYEPVTLPQLEHAILTLSQRVEASVDVIGRMWDTRYQTERDLIEARGTAIMKSTRPTVMEKRAEADLATLELRRKHDDAKAVLHAAEELQRALRARLSGMQTLIRTIPAAIGSQR
ncbi:hypothetical protein [Mycetocola spongiae]|uniref:hypothetical protein n=1 Tax=Mycetocola spongiae TaxID=2859226 RepID=UPI001CF3E950|nr:hypothetical protein [Mycetocola spongiae]UCR89275.1 hypothetical protein KXZ72_00740 [Mycetocola spongiae]